VLKINASLDVTVGRIYDQSIYILSMGTQQSTAPSNSSSSPSSELSKKIYSGGQVACAGMVGFMSCYRFIFPVL